MLMQSALARFALVLGLFLLLTTTSCASDQASDEVVEFLQAETGLESDLTYDATNWKGGSDNPAAGGFRKHWDEWFDGNKGIKPVSSSQIPKWRIYNSAYKRHPTFTNSGGGYITVQCPCTKDNVPLSTEAAAKTIVFQIYQVGVSSRVAKDVLYENKKRFEYIGRLSAASIKMVLCWKEKCAVQQAAAESKLLETSLHGKSAKQLPALHVKWVNPTESGHDSSAHLLQEKDTDHDHVLHNVLQAVKEVAVKEAAHEHLGTDDLTSLLEAAGKGDASSWVCW